jgi:hypothetical protein
MGHATKIESRHHEGNGLYVCGFRDSTCSSVACLTSLEWAALFVCQSSCRGQSASRPLVGSDCLLAHARSPVDQPASKRVPVVTLEDRGIAYVSCINSYNEPSMRRGCRAVCCVERPCIHNRPTPCSNRCQNSKKQYPLFPSRLKPTHAHPHEFSPTVCCTHTTS